jgi:hypothetical protein
LMPPKTADDPGPATSPTAVLFATEQDGTTPDDERLDLVDLEFSEGSHDGCHGPPGRGAGVEAFS